MQINLDSIDAKYIIEKYDDNSITISGKNYMFPFILMPDLLIDNLDIGNIQELSFSQLNIITSKHPEIIIFSSDTNNLTISPKLASQIMQQGIGVEVMSTSAACRTYAVLAAEKRNFAVVFCKLSG